MKGQIVIMSGPSGVGKDTLIDAWKEINSAVERIVAYTTRPARRNEINHIDYHFIDAQKFQEMQNSDIFVGPTEFFNYQYGITKEDVAIVIDQNKIGIMKMDIDGSLTAIEQYPNAISIFIHPPDITELRNRLVLRGLESQEDIDAKIKEARKEIKVSKYFQFQIVNTRVKESVKILQTIITDMYCK